MSNQLNSDEAREFLRASGLVYYDDFLVDLPLEPHGSPSSSPAAEEGRRELARVRDLAASTASEDGPVFLGADDYDHHAPLSVDRLASQLEFHRASAEGRDELSDDLCKAVLLFQQKVCRLAGMASANVSLYRGGSALGCACLYAVEATGRELIVAPTTLSPEATSRLDAYARAGSFELRVVPSRDGLTDLDALRQMLEEEGRRTAAVVAPYPNFYGCLERVGRIEEATRAAGALFVMAVDPVALAILRSPAEWGADLVASDVHAVPARREKGAVRLGFVAASRIFLENAPPTLARRVQTPSDDWEFCLARDFGRGERPKSPIGARALDPLRTLVHLAYSDERELRRVAKISRERALFAHDALAKAGFEFLYEAPFLREFAVKVADPAGTLAYLEKWGIVGGYRLDDGLLLAFTEKRGVEEIEELVYFMTEYRDRAGRAE